MTKPCESTCPKCGDTNVVRELREKGSYYEVAFRKPFWIKEPWVKQVRAYTYTFERECITHHCRGCHYEWATAPLMDAA